MDTTRQLLTLIPAVLCTAGYLWLLTRPLKHPVVHDTVTAGLTLTAAASHLWRATGQTTVFWFLFDAAWALIWLRTCQPYARAWRLHHTTPTPAPDPQSPPKTDAPQIRIHQQYACQPQTDQEQHP